MAELHFEVIILLLLELPPSFLVDVTVLLWHFSNICCIMQAELKSLCCSYISVCIAKGDSFGKKTAFQILIVVCFLVVYHQHNLCCSNILGLNGYICICHHFWKKIVTNRMWLCDPIQIATSQVLLKISLVWFCSKCGILTLDPC